MNMSDRQHLISEQTFLRQQLAQMPASARITRMGAESRLRSVESKLAEMPLDEREPARARLTFNGAPVLGSRGIVADFGLRAVNSFSEIVASVAASLSAPLSAMGPIPQRAQHQLLITSTAVGSFGFELEEFRSQQLALTGASPVSTALAHTQALLQSTLQGDDELADVASETDPRALEKARAFLKVLADNDAVCTLQFGDQGVRFTDVTQVRQSLARLSADNLREEPQTLCGAFVGALPNSRTFEFVLSGGEQVIKGKIAPTVEQVDTINQHLNQITQIDVMLTQVGQGKPRYLLTRLPEWPKAIA
jgi:hypothetical protein